MIKNYFYSIEIANRIKEILDNELPEEFKNISTGDFSILPPPDRLEEFLPAVIIDVDNNNFKSLNAHNGMTNQVYKFSINYIYPYDFKAFQDTSAIARKNAETIGNILLNYPTLNDFFIERNEKEIGGEITSSTINEIKFDNAETQFFRALDIPASIVEIPFEVSFITYERR